MISKSHMYEKKHKFWSAIDEICENAYKGTNS